MSPIRSAPPSGCSCAGDHPEERGLAGAVRADHADDAAARQAEREVLHQHAVVVALRHALGFDDEVAQPLADRDVDLDVVELHVLLVGDEALEVAQARLRLVAARACAHPDPLELAVDRPLARLLLLLLGGEPLLLLLEPRRVVALERDAVAAVELEDPAGHVVEEVAVVGDDDDGARVLLQVALEPRDRLGVEVVRGLVQQQQVRRRQEQLAQRDAAPLAAGELRHVGVARRQAQRVHRDVELLVEAPRVRRVDPLLHAARTRRRSPRSSSRTAR